MNSYIQGLNHWDLDPDIQPILFHALPEYQEKEDELRKFGELAGGRIYALANHEPEPMLQTRDENGKYIDRVQLAPEYNNLLNKLGFCKSVVLATILDNSLNLDNDLIYTMSLSIT